MARERRSSLPLGELVARQRERLSLSLEETAQRIQSAAVSEGEFCGFTRQTMYEIERGRIPHPRNLRWVAAGLGLAVEQVTEAARYQRATHRELLAPGKPQAPWERDGGIPPSEESSKGGLLSASPSMRRPIGSKVGLLSGTNGVTEDGASDAAAMRAFRAADLQVGGGHLYATVLHYLQAEIAPRLFGGMSGADSRAVFTAAAGLTEMAGWMAHDGGHDAVAERHFHRALDLVKVGGDRQLDVHILGSMSHLAHHLNKPDEAIALTRSGQEILRRSGPPNPGLRARLLAMEARGVAAQRESAKCARLLVLAENALADEPAEAPSQWVSHFDEGSLASEAARCMRQLGQFDEAERQAQRVIALRPGDRRRSRAFGQLGLVMALIARGKPDEACAVAHEVLNGTQSLSSFLVLQQLRELHGLLTPYRSNRVVAEFLECLTGGLRERLQLYRWLVADGHGGPIG
jgi:hypothetical protein